MTPQALLRAKNFGLSSHCLKNCEKLFRNSSGSNVQDQNSPRASGLATSLRIRSILLTCEANFSLAKSNLSLQSVFHLRIFPREATFSLCLTPVVQDDCLTTKENLTWCENIRKGKAGFSAHAVNHFARNISHFAERKSS